MRQILVGVLNFVVIIGCALAMPILALYAATQITAYQGSAKEIYHDLGLQAALHKKQLQDATERTEFKGSNAKLQEWMNSEVELSKLLAQTAIAIQVAEESLNEANLLYHDSFQAQEDVKRPFRYAAMMVIFLGLNLFVVALYYRGLIIWAGFRGRGLPKLLSNIAVTELSGDLRHFAKADRQRIAKLLSELRWALCHYTSQIKSEPEYFRRGSALGVTCAVAEKLDCLLASVGIPKLDPFQEERRELHRLGQVTAEQLLQEKLAAATETIQQAEKAGEVLASLDEQRRQLAAEANELQKARAALATQQSELEQGKGVLLRLSERRQRIHSIVRKNVRTLRNLIKDVDALFRRPYDDGDLLDKVRSLLQNLPEQMRNKWILELRGSPDCDAAGSEPAPVR